jgi:hypothetical protein
VQQVRPAPHACCGVFAAHTHVEFTQFGAVPEGQVNPQRPQFAASFVVLTHVPAGGVPQQVAVGAAQGWLLPH